MTTINDIKIMSNNLIIDYNSQPSMLKYMCNPSSNYSKPMTCVQNEYGTFDTKEECETNCKADNKGLQYPNNYNLCYYNGDIYGQVDKNNNHTKWLGTFNVHVNNKLIQNVVVTTASAELTNVNGNNMTIYGNSLFMFAKGPCSSRDPQSPYNSYWSPSYTDLDFNYFNFKDSILQFDMKINNVGNHLNANIYLIAPIKDKNKNDASNFFCSGNAGNVPWVNVIPNYCTEIDIIECNLYGSTFTPHICPDTTVGGTGDKCATFMKSNINSNSPSNTGCASDGCQSKTIDDTGKQWFGLNPLTGDAVIGGVDPREYFKVTMTITKEGGIETTIEQNSFKKTALSMLPENDCPLDPGKCGLPYYGCDKFTNEDDCNKNGGIGLNNGRKSNNLCNWENDSCQSWAGTGQWPGKETFNQFLKQLDNGFMIVGGIWGSDKSEMSWVSNTSMDKKLGNNDISQASLSIKNMTLNNN